MPYTDYFHPGRGDPGDLPRLSLRSIDGLWHVVATEPGHCEHVHGDGFSVYREAARLRDWIERDLKAGQRMDILRFWETRALIPVEDEMERAA